MRNTGICIFNTLPCRDVPSHKSQMSNQLLFGETYQVCDQQGEWLLIESDHDRYTCWISLHQHQPYDKAQQPHMRILDSPVVFIEHQYLSYKQLIPVFAGSLLADTFDKFWKIGDHTFFYPAIEKKTRSFSPENIRQLASLFLHSPYLWGGRSPAGIDCSGLVQVVMGMMNIPLPRDAYQQADEGQLVDFIHEVKPGDLAFFDNPDGQIVHTGIIINNEQLVHASGSVRIDRIDHEGIFHSEQKKYTHRLRVIKRVF